MSEQPVKGDEALRRMAGKALDTPSSPPSRKEGKDPLEEARDFTKQMAASSIIESEVAKSQASAEKAKAEAEEAKTRAERARSGKSEEREMESGIKTKGEFDLGKFNVQDILQQQIADRDELKRQAEESASRQQVVSDDLREKLHAAEMEVLKTSFNAQMQTLTKMIEANAAKGTFMEQYQATRNMAQELGFNLPQAGGDFQAQVELKKLDFEQNLQLRKFTREEKRADRDFQRQLRVDEDEREFKRKEAERSEKRDQMFASAPEVIGRAVGSALVQGQGAGAEPAKGRSRGRHVEAGFGDAGETECPSCGQPIGIGPTARTAVCGNCGTRIPIRRVGERPGAEPSPEPEVEEE